MNVIIPNFTVMPDFPGIRFNCNQTAGYRGSYIFNNVVTTDAEVKTRRKFLQEKVKKTFFSIVNRLSADQLLLSYLPESSISGFKMIIYFAAAFEDNTSSSLRTRFRLVD